MKGWIKWLSAGTMVVSGASVPLFIKIPNKKQEIPEDYEFDDGKIAIYTVNSKSS